MTDQPRKRPPGRPVETPGLQQKTIWLTQEQLDWLDAQPGSRSEAARRAIDAARGES